MAKLSKSAKNYPLAELSGDFTSLKYPEITNFSLKKLVI